MNVWRSDRDRDLNSKQRKQMNMKPTRSSPGKPSADRKAVRLDRSSDKHSQVLKSAEREVEVVSQRLRSRSGMRTAQIRYRRLLNAARGGILILYRNKRKFTDVNPFMN